MERDTHRAAFSGQLLFRLAVATVVLFLGRGHAVAQDRGGFTALVDVGVGIQHDTAIGDAGGGLTGVNMGVGGFLTRDLALLFRITGTVAPYTLDGFGDYLQFSGVAGPTVQYWLSNRFNVEAGVGVGFWGADNQDVSRQETSSLGVILGGGATLFNRGKHNLQFDVQYAPAFTEPGTVHNVSFTFGYQFL